MDKQCQTPLHISYLFVVAINGALQVIDTQELLVDAVLHVLAGDIRCADIYRFAVHQNASILSLRLTVMSFLDEDLPAL